MDENQDSGLLTEFVAESLQGLQSIEQDLLSLESDGGGDVALVNRIFRAVHSIKGTGSYMGLEQLVRLSHLAETLLDQIRSGTRAVTPDVTDAILASVDDLVRMLNTEDLGASFDSQESMNKLGAVLGTTVPQKATTQSSTSDQQVKSAEVPPPTPSRPSQSETPTPTQGPALAEHDAALIEEFTSESLQSLTDIEADLLTLEKDGGSDRELVNRIFRAVHTIKGNGSYLKLENLVSVSHRAETLLDRVRSGTESANAVVTDAVLAAVDALMTMLRSADLGSSFDCRTALGKLDAALGVKTAPSLNQGSVPGLTAEALEKIRSAIARKGQVFRMQIELADLQQTVDIKEGVVVGLSSIGTILHSSIPIADLDKTTSGVCVIYLETVLDGDMLADHFNIKPEKIVRVTLQQLTEESGKVAAPSMQRVQSSTTPPVQSLPVTPPASPAENTAEPTSSASKQAAPKGEAQREAVKSPPDQTMRVPVQILHKLLEWTGTMVMARNQLMNEYQFQGSTAFRTLSQSITGVHETVIATRMQTTGSLFERYRRVVRDLSRQLNKEVALHIEGGDLELDRSILESFADPLTHLIRNSLDHALETPAEREAAGKNRQGNIYLRSYIHSGEIILAVEDDGRGICAKRVSEKAVSKGVITQEVADQLTEHQKVMLIFHAGFSTKDQATDVSGRGVGMDVVRNNIESVGGSIDVVTKVGSGTTFSAILPLAKALVSSSLTKALVVEIQDEQFAIPETAVSEIIQYDDRAKSNIVQVDGERVYQLRDQLVALVDLREALELDQQPAKRENACLVILQFRKHQFGAIVDNVLGIQEIIVRGTPKLLQDCQVFSGHSVLGTGRVSLILDINGLVNKLALKFQTTKKNAIKRNTAIPASAAIASPNTRQRQKMVVFSFADNEFFAIPLELVSIIERISLDSIRTVGEKEYCQIKSETISLMRLNSFLPISAFNESRKDCCLIRPAAVSYPIGILTGPDVTVIDVDDNFESRLEDNKGIVGTFLHNDRLVMLLDVFSVFEKHAPDKLKSQDIPTGHAKILVAEDSLFFRKLIKQYMEKDEWSIEIVNDGQEAWERLQAEPNRYNLIISDINMPRMDGFQLAARVRDDRRFDLLPMVALTTLSDDHFREKGLSLGFDRYVVKIDKNQVRTTVAECLQIRRAPNKK
jgi:two-component system chemotaxis sensor kinase CheA